MWSWRRKVALATAVLVAVVVMVAGGGSGDKHSHHQAQRPQATLLDDVDVNYGIGHRGSPAVVEQDAEIFSQYPAKVNQNSVMIGQEDEVLKPTRPLQRVVNNKRKLHNYLKNKKKNKMKETVAEVSFPTKNIVDNAAIIDQNSSVTDQNSALVSRRWGIPDQEAVSGEIFSLVFPPQAFAGTVLRYTVSRGCRDK